MPLTIATNCSRCEKNEEPAKVLLLASEEKNTMLYLCPYCFESARQIFTTWFDNGSKLKSTDEETSNSNAEEERLSEDS